MTFTGNLLGGNTLQVYGPGQLILTGSSACATTTINSGGVLQIGGGLTSGSLGTGAVTDNGSLVFDRSDTVTVGSQTISGTGTLTMLGSGTLVLGSTNTYSGGTSVNAGTINFASKGLGTGAVTVNPGSGNTVNLVWGGGGNATDLFEPGLRPDARLRHRGVRFPGWYRGLCGHRAPGPASSVSPTAPCRSEAAARRAPWPRAAS